MCGIFGIYNLKNNVQFDEGKFRDSLYRMNYRGPNSSNVRTFDSNIIIGHLRLAIIDLNEDSNQPFEIDNKLWIVYNGEIYNYIEIRNELIELGVDFKTSSDTEVLIRSFQVWGQECVNKFNGMWSFVIYNKEENSIFCSRDRFGVKPFNYSIINDQFVFSSEIKSIINYFPNLKKPNYNIIANYCRSSVGAQINQTWFENIFRLEPAHNLYIKDGNLVKTRYWNYPEKVNNKIDFDEAVNKYREIFNDAVLLRMRSDVPIGFTLSSGIDSTSLLCIANNNLSTNKLTYTAKFEEQQFLNTNKNFSKEVNFDESLIVTRLTKDLNFNANIIPVNFDDFTNQVSELIFFLESGHSSPAIIPLHQILEIAKKDVTVLIEGQGADELLGGYVNNIFPFYLFELLSKFRFIKAISEIRLFFKNYSFKATFMLLIRNSSLKYLKEFYYYFSGINKLFIGKLNKYKPIKDFNNDCSLNFDSPVNSHLYKSHIGGLVNLLHYGDAISMANSLESRLPFMDYRLVEFVFTLPYDFKYNDGKGKYIHREAMKGYVPDYILENKIKIGFETPLHDLFKDTSESSISNILLSKKTLDRNLFSKKYIEKAINDIINGKSDNSRILFRMLCVELWFRNFIDN